MADRPRDARGRFVSSGSGGGVNLGNAYGRIILSDNVDQAVNQAQQAFDRGIGSIGQSMQRFGDSMVGVGTRLTALTAPITAFGVTGVNAAMRFENALVEIAARAQLTEEELERVRAKALEIGRDTQFSAGQGAEAFLQLLTSGQSMEEAFATIDSVILGAAASGEELGFVSDALTDIMAQFGLEADDASMILQTLSNAAGSSSASFSDLVAGFQNSGGTAAQAGMSVEQLAATLAVLSENGIKGSEAGTALRSTLNALQRDTEDVIATMDSLGITLFDAAGNARPMEAVFQDIQDATAGMTDEQRIAVFNNLADSYARQGLAALTSGDGIDEMMEAMRDGANVTDIAASRMDTFDGSVKSLMGSIETLQIEVLTPFMNNTLQPLVEQITGVINRVTEWAKENPELANTIVMIGAGLVTLGPLLIAAGTAISAIGAALAFVLSPLGLIVAAVAAVGLAIATDFGGVRTWIEGNLLPVLNELGEWFTTSVLPQMAEVWRMFSGLLASVWEEIGPPLGQLANWFVVDGIPLMQNMIEQIFIPALNLMVSVLVGIWDLVGPVLGNLLTWFVETGLPAATTFLNEIAIPAINDLITVLSGLWGDVQVPLTQFRDFVVGIFEEIIGWIDDTIGKFQDAIEAIQSGGGLNRTGQGNGGLFGSGIGPNFDPIGGIRDVFDSGGYAEPNSIAHVGQGQMGREVFAVGDQGGTFYPDFMQNLTRMVAGVVASREMPGSGSMTENGLSQPGTTVVVNIEVPLDVLRNEPALQTNAETLAQSIRDSMRRRG